MLEAIKLALRIKSNAYDNEIMGLISACKADLRISGIIKVSEVDPLIQRAAILYCKANFGNDKDSQKFADAYNALKISLGLAGDYLV